MRNTIAAADLLRTARREAGLTQLELAERSGIRQSVISAYERSRRQPSVAALERLLTAMGLRLSLVRDAEQPLLPYDAGRRLIDVLGLADAMPTKHTADLAYPPFAGGPQAAAR
jgi:transcriptional regulator with XRE-family HTH domain